MWAGLDVLDFHYQVVQLNRLDWQTYLRHPNPLATALLAKMRIPRRERVRAKRECLYALAGMRLERSRKTMLAAFIDIYLPLNPNEQQQLQTEIAALLPQERETVMELVTSWHIAGRAEGRVEGRVEGRAVPCVRATHLEQKSPAETHFEMKTR